MNSLSSISWSHNTCKKKQVPHIPWFGSNLSQYVKIQIIASVTVSMKHNVQNKISTHHGDDKIIETYLKWEPKTPEFSWTMVTCSPFEYKFKDVILCCFFHLHKKKKITFQNLHTHSSKHQNLPQPFNQLC